MRVLLIEDDSMLARAISAAIEHSGYRVDIAPTAESALRLARSADFQIAVLDLGLPDRDGLDLLKDIRDAGMNLPVLILSARDGLNDRIRGLDGGADDYLGKPFALGELEARLRALTRRGDEPVRWAELADLRFDVAGKDALAGDVPLVLTARELSILEILMGSGGKVVAKRALFRAVFPENSGSAPNALEVHVSRLRQKLEPARVTIRSIRGLGYRLEPACVTVRSTLHADPQDPQA